MTFSRKSFKNLLHFVVVGMLEHIKTHCIRPLSYIILKTPLMCETSGIFITPHFFGFAYCLLQNVVRVEKGIKLARFVCDSVESDFSPRLIDQESISFPLS